MGYLYYNSDSTDVLYVHASMKEQFNLYYRMYPIVANKIIPGTAGFPCCPRYVKEKYNKNDSGIVADVEKISQTNNASVVRLLFTGRQAHWRFIQREDPNLMKEELLERGLKHLKSIVSFKGILIEEYKFQD